jgi:hypothetical protein
MSFAARFERGGRHLSICRVPQRESTLNSTGSMEHEARAPWIASSSTVGEMLR